MSKVEVWWYFIGLGLTSGGLSSAIAIMMKPDSIFSFIAMGLAVGILWGPFWRLTFARLFREKGSEDGE